MCSYVFSKWVISITFHFTLVDGIYVINNDFSEFIILAMLQQLLQLGFLIFLKKNKCNFSKSEAE